MTRKATRRAFLFAIGMALGKLDALAADGGQLTCDLNQWTHVVFKHGKKVITIPVAEVFAALEQK